MDKKIASGLPGFGRIGDMGKKGVDGLAVYFTDLDGEINRQTLTDRIISGKSMIYNLEHVANNRPYMRGDVFVDINSNTYEIILSAGNAYKSLGHKYIPSNIFESAQYKNSFSFDKYTNVYMGDSKFLVDDIMSLTFSALEYSKPVYDGLVLGDFNKVNYVDLSVGSNGGVYLHEVFCNSATNENASMAIVSESAKIGSDNITFRMGNVKTIELKNGKNIFKPFDTSLVLDFKKLTIPKETYVIDDNGNESKVLTEAEYNPNIFRRFKQSMYSPDNHIKVGLNVTENENEYSMEISSYNILDFFDDGTFSASDIDDSSKRIKNLRVNIICNRKIGYGSSAPLLSLSDNNNFVVYDAPYKLDTPDVLTFDKLNGNTWQISFEIVDEVTGWTRVTESMDVDVTSSMLSLYPKFINSTLSNKQFTVNVRVSNGELDKVILTDYIVDVNPLSSLDKRLNIITPTIEDNTSIIIECVTVGNRVYEITSSKEELSSKKYLMFHLGYNNVHLPSYDYNENAFEFIKSVKSLDENNSYSIGGPRDVSYEIRKDSEYGIDTDTIFNNYHNIQEGVHTKRLKIVLFNNSKLELKTPKCINYTLSDSDMEDIYKVGFVDKKSADSDLAKIALFGESKEFEINIPKSKGYLYLLLSDITSISTDLPDYDDKVGNNPNVLSYGSEVYSFLAKKSHIIANPYANDNGNDVKTIYIIISDNAFTDTDNYLPYGNRGYWGKLNKDNNGNRVGPLLVDINISDSYTIPPFKLGFDSFYVKGKTDYSDSNNVCLKFDNGVNCGGFGMLNIDLSNINNATVPNKWLIDSTPFSFNGESKPVNVYMNSPLTPYNYTASYEVYNYDSIINGFFDFIKNKDNADKIQFNQSVFRPIKNNAHFSLVNDYYDFKSPDFYFDNTDEFYKKAEVMYFNDRSDRFSFNYILPTLNVNNDKVEVYDYIDVDVKTSFLPVHSSSGKFMIHANDANSRVITRFYIEYSYIDEHNGLVGNKKVLLDEKTNYFINFRQREASIPITKPIDFNINKRLKISDNGLKKTTFTYRFMIELDMFTDWKGVWFSYGNDNIGGNFDEEISLGRTEYNTKYEHEFRLKFNPIEHNIAYYGKRSDTEPQIRYVDARHKKIMLEYIK